MISCVKMNSNGNDFIVMNNMDRHWETPDLSKIASLLCRRHEAIGADGILVVEPSEKCHFTMRLFNRDGSEGEMCGNGARCIARYAYEEKIAPREMVFETLASDISAIVMSSVVRISMDEVNLEKVFLDCPVEFQNFCTRYSFLTTGVPHAVIFIENLREKSIATLTSGGKELRHRMDLFPQGANINFVSLEKDSLYSVTYERGVEEITRSCGTGAVASAIVSYLLDKTKSEVDVCNLGGKNNVSLSFEETQKKIFPFLSGSTVFVAQMEVFEEVLN